MILSKEYGLLANENPMQGSHLSAWLTEQVEEEILRIFEEMHRRGGVFKDSLKSITSVTEYKMNRWFMSIGSILANCQY